MERLERLNNQAVVWFSHEQNPAAIATATHQQQYSRAGAAAAPPQHHVKLPTVWKALLRPGCTSAGLAPAAPRQFVLDYSNSPWGSNGQATWTRAQPVHNAAPPASSAPARLKPQQQAASTWQVVTTDSPSTPGAAPPRRLDAAANAAEAAGAAAGRSPAPAPVQEAAPATATAPSAPTGPSETPAPPSAPLTPHLAPAPAAFLQHHAQGQHCLGGLSTVGPPASACAAVSPQPLAILGAENSQQQEDSSILSLYSAWAGDTHNVQQGQHNNCMQDVDASHQHQQRCSSSTQISQWAPPHQHNYFVQEIEAYLLEVQHHRQQQQTHPSTHATTAADPGRCGYASHAVQKTAATTSNHASAVAATAATQLPILQVLNIISAEQTHNVCCLLEGDTAAAIEGGEVPSGAALAAALHAAWSYQDVLDVDCSADGASMRLSDPAAADEGEVPSGVAAALHAAWSYEDVLDVDCAEDAPAAAGADGLQQVQAQQQQQHPEPWWQQQQQSQCAPMGIAASPGMPCAWETAPASGLVAGSGSSNAADGEGAQLYSSLVVQQPKQQQKTPRGRSRLGAAGSASASGSSALKKKKKGAAGSSHATPKVKTSTRSRTLKSRTTTAPPATPLAATAAPAGTVCAAAAAACAPGASAGRPQRKAAKLGIQKMQQAMRGQQQEDEWETWPEHTASRKLPKSRTASSIYEHHSSQHQQLQPQPHIYLCQPLWVNTAAAGSMQGQLGTAAVAGPGGADALGLMPGQQGEQLLAGWNHAVASNNSQEATAPGVGPSREVSAGSMSLLHLERCSTPVANNSAGNADAPAAGLRSVCSSGSARSVDTALQLPASASPSLTAAVVAGLAAVDVANGPAVQPAQRLWLWRQQQGTVAVAAGAAQDPAAVQVHSRLRLSLKGRQPVDRDAAPGTTVAQASGRLLLLMKQLHSLLLRSNSKLAARAPSRSVKTGIQSYCQHSSTRCAGRWLLLQTGWPLVSRR